LKPANPTLLPNRKIQAKTSRRRPTLRKKNAHPKKKIWHRIFFRLSHGSFASSSLSDLLHNMEQLSIISYMNEYLSEGTKPGEAVRLTAQKTGKSISSVKNLWYRNPSRFSFKHGNCRMSEDQEILIKSIINVLDMSKLPLSSTKARIVVKEVSGVDLPRSTFNRVKKENSLDLSVRNLTKVDEIKEFLERLKEDMDRIPYNENSVMSANETILECNPKGHWSIAKAGMKQPNQLGTKMARRFSVMPFVLANGTAFFAVIILKTPAGQESGWFEPPANDHDIPRIPKTSPNMCYYRTDSGELEQEDFMHIMDEFALLWNSLHPGLALYLFLDQSIKHAAAYTVKHMFKRNIHICFLPSDTSHFLQPLNSVPFAALKNEFRQLTQKYARHALSGSSSTKRFLNMAIQAHLQSLKSSVIKRGFRETGILPFDTEKILRNATDPSRKDPLPLDWSQNQLETTIQSAVSKVIDLPAPQQEQRKRKNADEELHVDWINAEDGELPMPKKKRKEAPCNEFHQLVSEDLRVCPAEDCGAKRHSGRGWSECSNCDQQFCPKHTNTFNRHIETCEMDILP
jgi:ACT domain-containing protein